MALVFSFFLIDENACGDAVAARRKKGKKRSFNFPFSGDEAIDVSALVVGSSDRREGETTTSVEAFCVAASVVPTSARRADVGTMSSVCGVATAWET